MVINWETIQVMIHEIYKSKGWVWPTPLDASFFTIQEAVEISDLLLREKNYVRNHDKPVDDLWKEIAQCMNMLFVICIATGHDPFKDFMKLYQEYTRETTNSD
jgi:NTP pyrophosphatase (non-canonical NTP hydrolase)